MSSTLASVARSCAENSIRGVLGAAVNLKEHYVVRLSALRTRLAPQQTRAASLTTATSSQSAAYYIMAVTVTGSALTATETSVKTTLGALIQRLRALPDLLLAALDGLSVTTSLSPTSSTVCPRVERALQPTLTEIASELSLLKPALDRQLQDIEHNLGELEKVALALGIK